MKNSAANIALQLSSVLVTFITRKVFLYYLGLEYAGVGGLFTNVLSLLALTELGFNSAITFSLYAPLERGDHQQVAALMRFFRFIYRIVAAAVAVIGLLLSLDLNLLVGETTLQGPELRLIYYLFLFKSVVSYLFAYRTTLAMADQKSYLFFKVDLIMKYVGAALNILIIVLTHNYILYLVCAIVLTLTSNIINSEIVKRHYPYLAQAPRLDKASRDKIVHDSRNIMVGQISGKILSSTDNVIISKLISVATVGLYGNYMQIVEAVQNMALSFGGAMQSTLGSLVASNDRVHCHEVLMRSTTIFMMMGTVIGTGLFCLTSPLVALMYDPRYVLSPLVVAGIVFNSFFQCAKTPLWQMLTVTGQFDKDKYISLIGAVSNLAISIAMVYWIGLAGVILGTSISQLIQMILKTRLLHRGFFGHANKGYVQLLVKGFLGAAISCAVAYGLCTVVGPFIGNEYVAFIADGIIAVAVSALVTILLYRGSEGYDYMRYLLRTYAGKLLHKRHVAK